MKRFYILFCILLFSSINTFSQNASDYFPSTPGYKWFYKVTPFDSLQNAVDSFSVARVDSFAGTFTYKDSVSQRILRKTGPKEVVLDISFIDTINVSLRNSNISLYVSSLIDIDTLGIGGFLSQVAGWYSVYRLSSPVNTSYTIFSKDTNVTLNSLALIITIEVKAKRLADQVITTPLGTFTCKKFLLSPAVKAALAILPFITYPIITINDTVYLAPGKFVVRDVTPSAKGDLSLAGLPSFWIYGNKVEILSPPAILNVNPLLINVKSQQGDTTAFISNSGSGTLRWKARVTSGNEWLSIISDSSGTNNSSIRFLFQQNISPQPRVGTIMVWDDSAFSPNRFITVNQSVPTETEDPNSTPYSYSLYDNYPNPFNPSTIIKYSLGKSGNVSLIAYNILGKEVAVIFTGYKNAGTYQVTFDASNLPSGIYFYKLNTESYSTIKKMILIK